MLWLSRSVKLAIAALAFAGCGRIGYQERATPDAAPNPCAGGDGICLASCIGIDPDCTTTCGDGRCVGNAGETCESCAVDCATQAPVCGNGACDPGEEGTCYTDCGPDPWTWTADEAALLAAVNMARVDGITCPGTASVVTAPALALTAALTPPAREWAWEIGYGNYYMTDAQACNGRTFAERSAAGGYITALSGYGFASGAAAATFYETDMASCPTLMDPARTEVGIGVTLDGQRGFVLVFK